MARARHQRKEVEAAVQDAEARGWIAVMKGGGHAWAVLRCPGGAGGCSVWVWSTPKNAGNHAKDIDRAVAKCKHKRGGK